MEEVETKTTFQDIQRTTTGTSTAGYYGRMLGRTDKENAKYYFSEALNSLVFLNIGAGRRTRMMREFETLPGFWILNPELAAVALLFDITGYEVTEKSFLGFKNQIKEAKLQDADVLRYIRFVKMSTKIQELG